MKVVLRLPLIWLLLMVLFTFLSVLNIAWLPSSGWSVNFHVEGTTALFLALIWLPALLRVFALVGGGIKTPAGEFTSSGLGTLAQVLDPDTIGMIIEQTAKAEDEAPQQLQAEARQARQELQQAYASRIPAMQIRKNVAELVQRYTSARAQMKPGEQRTELLEAIVGQMRALTTQADFSPVEIRSYLQSDDEGQRIFGLASVESSSDVNQFEPVLQMIGHSRSAFEQYHALRAMEQIASYLDTRQKLKLKDVIMKQRSYDPAKGQWLKLDSDQYFVSERLLAQTA